MAEGRELTAGERKHVEGCAKGCKKLYEDWEKNPRDWNARESLKKSIESHLDDERDRPKGFGQGGFEEGGFGE